MSDAFSVLSTPDYSRFIHQSRYARWQPDKKRRETWDETIDRYLDFMAEHLAFNHDYILDDELRAEIRSYIHSFAVMPSMRALMTAGTALANNNIAGYNCAFVPVDDVKAFSETLYILMHGTGVGFRVLREDVRQLPVVPESLQDVETTIIVEDNKEGWRDAFLQLLSMLYGGMVPKWDVSKVRPAGARLRTFGGRASGPGPLVDLFRYTINLFRNAAGRQLTSLECHDLECKIAEIVVVGGVRRSAMISLSNVGDNEMRNAKSGAWWDSAGHRRLANNSAYYIRRPDVGTFMDEWMSLFLSKSGERGIFNAQAAIGQAARNGRRVIGYTADGEPVTNFERSGVNYIAFGTNPCSEIILRPFQFCNLSELVVRPTDTEDDLHKKARIASILGTFQSTLTYFPGLRSIWKTNTEEERLLGVSMTGIMDNPLTAGLIENVGNDNGAEWVFAPYDRLPALLERVRNTVVETNAEFAILLGIPQSAATTCVKPSGTVSQLVDAASGMHARHAQYHIRTVRGDKKDPITQFMIDQGIPHEDDISKPDSTTVFSFPMKAPENAITRANVQAIAQLELWKVYQLHWCEHKPSITVSVRDPEWPLVGAWCWENFDILSGVSFLPYSDHTYQQAPYQDCTEQEYNEALAAMPTEIDWSKLSDYEDDDNTASSQTLACSGSACEIVDVGDV